MSRKILFIALFFLSTSFIVAQQINIKYQRFQLKNGLDVVLHEDHSVPVVSVNVWYHVGSGMEKPGHTGFAHLFEHIMFEGSAHVPQGKFSEWLESTGADNNGSTTTYRTTYWENVPSNALELALFLEADRMGHLLDVMTPARVDQQRDVVKNERRQSYENEPYGMASITIDENLYPPDHPFHWPTIGSMEDLTAASYQDVVDFFNMYYRPNNASLVIAGDIDPVKAKELVIKWFNDIPAGKPLPPLSGPPAYLTESKKLVMEDNVELPRLYMNWLTPATFCPGDAELDIVANILAGGKNSRLYKRLVYDMQIAQDVAAEEASSPLVSTFGIAATARAGHTLAEIEKVIWEEINKLKTEPPTDREVGRAVNEFEASFLDRIELVGGFDGKADLLNNYLLLTGNPDYFNEDLSRYKALSPEDIQTAAQTYLKENANVVLSIVPHGKQELAVPVKGK